MRSTKVIRETVSNNYNFTSWAEGRKLQFHSIGNKTQADLIYEDNLMIFSSQYSPILRFVDENDNSTEYPIKSFNIEDLNINSELIRSDKAIGLKKLEDVGYFDSEIIEETKSSFRFQGLTPIKQINLCKAKFEGSDNYSIIETNSENKERINTEIKIDANIDIQTGILIELENEKTILIKYISDFELYFAIIGAKQEIINRNFLTGKLVIANKRIPLRLTEETTYNTV